MAKFNVEEAFSLSQQLWQVRTVIASVQLSVFEKIGKTGSGKTATEFAKEAGLDLRGTTMLLNALIPLELLDRDDDGKYTPTADAKKYFIPGEPSYLGNMLIHMGQLWISWGELDESVRTGKPYWQRHAVQRNLDSLVTLAEMLFARNLPFSKKAAAKLGVGKEIKGAKILDVAAGSGAWSLGFLLADPTAKAVAVDFEPVLKMAAGKAASVGAGDRFEIKPGNVREIDFGGGFDIAILGHICHSEGAEYSGKLIEKAAKSLAPGGMIAIAEMVPDDDRRGPAHPLLFALNMLVNTVEGGTYTFAEYKKWLEDAGLANVSKVEIDPAHSPLIIARKT